MKRAPTMIAYEDARALLDKYGLHPDIVRHSEGVAEVARDLARRMIDARPGLDIDLEKVRVAGLLHDIGRCRPGIHERNSENILREEGLDEIAAIIMHGTLFEGYLLLGKRYPSLLPQTLEQKIVCYADLRFCQRPLTLDERIDDALERKKECLNTTRTLDLARERLFELEREMLALAGPEQEKSPAARA